MRIPFKRPPTRPGEMLCERFTKPLRHSHPVGSAPAGRYVVMSTPKDAALVLREVRSRAGVRRPKTVSTDKTVIQQLRPPWHTQCVPGSYLQGRRVYSHRGRGA